jgi:hypothetical protein
MDTPYTVELMRDQARTLARFAEYDSKSTRRTSWCGCSSTASGSELSACARNG